MIMSGLIYNQEQECLFLLHLLQDGDDHVKLWSLGWVFVHAEPHQLTDVGRNTWRDGWPKTLKSHLRNGRAQKMRQTAGSNMLNKNMSNL